MFLSVSIKQTEEGYIPRLVKQTPRFIDVFVVGRPCSSYQEAWIISRLAAKNHRFAQELHA